MKTKYIVVLALSLSAVAHADPNCAALSSAVGTYKPVSATCDVAPFAPMGANKIAVVPFQNTDNGATYSAYWIVVSDLTTPINGTGIGPSTSPKDIFRCNSNGSTVTVSDPLGADYNFNGPSLTISYRGCSFSYTRDH